MNTRENKDEPKGFYSDPIGSLLSYAIHEQNAGIGSIKWQIKKISNKLKELSISDPTISTALEAINLATKKQEDGMDYIYEKVKKKLGYGRKTEDKDV